MITTNSQGCRAPRTINGQKFMAVASRQVSGQHGKLMQMPGEAHVEQTEAEAESSDHRSLV
jgi:hypothetical protein